MIVKTGKKESNNRKKCYTKGYTKELSKTVMQKVKRYT